jgi:hypothetical protein
VTVTEVSSPEAAVGAIFLEDRDVRLDPALLDEPGEVCRIAVASVGGEALRIMSSGSIEGRPVSL